MIKTQKSKTNKWLAVDVGNVFTKVGVFVKNDNHLEWRAFEILPSNSSGLFVDPPIGNAQATWDLSRLLVGDEAPPTVLASTSRLPQLRVMIGGFANDDIDDALRFCQTLGIEVMGICTPKQTFWHKSNQDLNKDLDAVLMVGGFERHKSRQVLHVAQNLAATVAKVPFTLPIFFVGCEELLTPLSGIFAEQHKVYLVPDLWPGKRHKNYMQLFVELQQILLHRAQTQDLLLPKIHAEVESNYSSLLASLSLLIEHWHENVLLVDIGATETRLLWARYIDGYNIPIWAEAESIYAKEDEQHGHKQLFGMKVLPQMGLSSPMELYLDDAGLKQMVSLWPENEGQQFRDRILNHRLYPDTVPDAADLKWQTMIVKTILGHAWQSIPPDFQPKHIVLSGSFFGLGTRLETLIDDALLPSNLPFTATLWMNKAAVLPLLGLLLKAHPHSVEELDVEQYLVRVLDFVRFAGKPRHKGVLGRVTIDTNNPDVEAFDVKMGEIHAVGAPVGKSAILRIKPESKAKVSGFAMAEEVVIRVKVGVKGFYFDGRV